MGFRIRPYQTASNRFAYQARGLQVLLAAEALRELLRKAGFRPDQPRVPRGNPEGGQWTHKPGWARAQTTPSQDNAISSDNLDPIVVSDIFEEEDDDIPWDDIEERISIVPAQRPDSLGERYSISRGLLLPFRGRALTRKPSETLQKLGPPPWLHQYYPHIDAYMSPAKTLRQLQSDARIHRIGYDRHHLNEKTPALRENFPKSLVDGPDNLVSIPRFKHWEVTAWFSTRNKNYGGLSPREYLRAESWENRTKVGLDALREAGVLR